MPEHQSITTFSDKKVFVLKSLDQNENPDSVQLTQTRLRWSSLNQLAGVWTRPCHGQPKCRDVAVPLPWSRDATLFLRLEVKWWRRLKTTR